jgi:phospholipid/cholesterol/gamma-HCH transport system substrate-binding protein
METVVGAFVVMIFLGIAYFTIILSRETWFAKKWHIEAVFSNVTSLGKGDLVVVRGMPVGQVNDLRLEPDGVHVTTTLDQEIKIHSDYKVTILSSSVLGGRRLEIDAGSTSMPELPMGPDTILRGSDPADLMADASEMVSKVKDALVTGGVVSNLQVVASNLNAITTQIRSGEGTIGKLIFAKDTVVDDLSATALSLRHVVEGLENGNGTIGKLMKDDAVYDRITRTMDDFQATLDEYRETAPVVTFTSIFFGAF